MMEPYKKRFVIEYRQLSDRIDRLSSMLSRWDDGELDFTPTCPRQILSGQLSCMKEYRSILEMRAIVEDVDLKSDEVDYPGCVSDGYHTFDELYRYRMLYNAAFLNEYASHQDVVAASDGNMSIVVRDAGKSRLHHDGTRPFGGGWFVVWFRLPDGKVVSNHYRDRYWDLFRIDEFPTAPEWDGSSPEQEADRMERWIEGGGR